MRKQLIALALASILIGGLYAQDNPNNPPETQPQPQAPELNEQMPPMPHHLPGGGWARRKAEEFNRVLEKLKADDPKEYQRIEKLRKTDQEQYFRELKALSQIRMGADKSDETREKMLGIRRTIPNRKN